MDYFKCIIYEKNVNNVQNISVDNSLIISVQFKDYEIKHKINKYLRSFFAIIQQLNIKKISKGKKILRASTNWIL